MMTDVTLYGQREDYDYRPGGQAAKGVRATFSVGPDGPFSVFVADSDYTPQTLLAAVEQKADSIRAARVLHEERRG